MPSVLPRYPVYVISKGRHDTGYTAKFLLHDKVPFKIVVEPQERDAYASAFGAENLLLLPFSNLGLGGIPARNWCWEHAKESGAARHWILDDNIRSIRRNFRGKRFVCSAGPALAAVEDFTDRYENIAIAGLQYNMFAINRMPPFYLNTHVYSCLLIDNAITQRWRGRYNEDTDLCLQVLAAGMCTVNVNAFTIEKMRTMTMKGGNSDQLYKGDGRLRMARSLQRVWPHVVETDRRFNRPQHKIRDEWKKFDTPLRLKPGIDLSEIRETNEYGLVAKVDPNIKAQRLVRLLNDDSYGREPRPAVPTKPNTEGAED
jgi:hypothetical protein